MSGLWVPEERHGSWEPILDLWAEKLSFEVPSVTFYYGAKRGFTVILSGFLAYMYDMLSYGFPTYHRGHLLLHCCKIDENVCFRAKPS